MTENMRVHQIIEFHEGPVHMRTERFILPNGQIVRRRDNVARLRVLDGNAVETTGRVGEFTGGGYERDIVTDKDGRCQLMVGLYGRIVGGSKEGIVDMLLSLGRSVEDILPYAVIDATNGVRIFLGNEELGKSDNNGRFMTLHSLSAGVHSKEKNLPCGRDHQGKVYLEQQVRLRGISGPAFAHFDLESPNGGQIVSDALRVIADPNFPEQALRDIIDPVLLVP